MRLVSLTLFCAFLCACSGQDPGSTDDLQFLRDPASGMCMPVMADANGETPYAGWETCANPCAEHDDDYASCVADPRCKPRFAETMCPPDAACAPAPFEGCDPNPQPDACLGLDENSCSKTAGCEPIYGGVECDCADGKMCACPALAVYRGCHAKPGTMPGTCTSDNDCGMGAHCTSRDGACLPPPGCDQGEVCPAICAGVCVPDGDPGSSCFAIDDEDACVGRKDCEPVYAGSRCFCDPEGCGCLEYTFDTCRPRASFPGCPAEVAGTWGGDKRAYTFDKDGTFLVEDDVGKCPPDAVCVWEGVIRNHGAWFLDASGDVALTYQEPVTRLESLSLATRLTFKGCDTLIEVDTGRAFNKRLMPR